MVKLPFWGGPAESSGVGPLRTATFARVGLAPAEAVGGLRTGSNSVVPDGQGGSGGGCADMGANVKVEVENVISRTAGFGA